jgi:hypothetical protein
MPLVNHLTSTLLLHEPDDPVAFLKLQVEDMINFRDHQGKPPILFKKDHLINVFKGVDYLNIGSIDLKQYFKGEFNHYQHILMCLNTLFN